MADREWTKAQKEAIRARNRSILVSAAAGSGKTSVMIERVITLLRAGAQLERMLIITFTRAAAGEMRDRLTDALAKLARDDERLREQYDAIGRAQISTLHSFCARLLARHFEPIGADPLTRTGDEALTASLFDGALDDAVTAFYEQPDEGGRALAARFGDEEIAAMARALYRFLMAQADPFGWLDRALALAPDAESLKASPLAQVMLDSARLSLEGALQYADACEEVAMLPGGPARYLPNCEEDRAAARAAMEALDGGRPLGFLKNYRATVLRRTKAPDSEDEALRERFKKLRERGKKCMQQAGRLLPGDGAEWAKSALDIAETLPQLKALAGIVRSLHARYGEKKSARAVRDYSDLEHMALAALSHPGVAKEAASQFDSIFVDEYQDISRTQEAIIAALHRDNDLFMVGDVKQAIYRFRLADPTLFLSKYKAFSADGEADSRRILLKENFRSQPNILTAVNEVFSLAMRERVTELAYGEDAQLNAGRRPEQAGAPVELLLIARGAGEQEGEEDAPDTDEGLSSAAQLEAAAIAERIAALHEGPEKLRYQDMVILLRSAASRAEDMARVLKDRGIPVYNDADAQYYELPEIRDTLDILAVLDDPTDDVALLSVLRCPVFHFTEEELAQMRLKGGPQPPFWQLFFDRRAEDKRVARTLDRLDEWRFMAQHEPLDLFLRTLIDQSGLYARAGALPGGAQRRANLMALAARAAGSPWTLRTFNRQVSDARRRSRETAALGEMDDVVRIMTIHKSKGLEFPVVFVAGLAQRFKFDDGPSSLSCDSQLGLAIPLIDPKKRTVRQTLAARAIREKKQRETRAEEARLLYVAMTRARDRLYLTGAPRRMDTAMDAWRMPPGDFAVGSARCMLDWVGQALWAGLETGEERFFTGSLGAVWRITPIPAFSLAAARADSAPFQAPRDAAVSDRVRALLERRPAPEQPAKTSVTALIRRALPEEEETAQTKRAPQPPQLAPLPRLAGRDSLTGAERGTLAHRALCALPLEGARGADRADLPQAVDALLDRLRADGVLSFMERQSVDAGMIARFLASPLGQRMLRAPRVLREKAFTLRIEDGVLVQGVLDCCFEEDGGWVLIDYKTDHDAAALPARYRDQMRWYMRALRTLTGLPVREAWLFALRTGEAFEITEESEIRLAANGEEQRWPAP